jgi:hypothetical protein
VFVRLVNVHAARSSWFAAGIRCGWQEGAKLSIRAIGRLTRIDNPWPKVKSPKACL